MANNRATELAAVVDAALASRFFLVYQPGPTVFVLKVHTSCDIEQSLLSKNIHRTIAMRMSAGGRERGNTPRHARRAALFVRGGRRQ